MIPRLLVLFFFLCQSVYAMTVNTTIDPKEIDLGESFIVTYVVDGQIQEPDFSPLESSFTIVNRSQSQNISIINGQTSYELVWHIVLMPKYAGVLTVPAIEFGVEKSQPSTVKVNEPNISAESPDMFIEFSADDLNPYLKQQVVLTTQVFSALEIDDIQITLPRVLSGEAEIEKLGQGRRFSSVRAGKRYSVLEQRYTLLPQQQGKLTLAPIQLTGSKGSQNFDVASDSIILDVLNPNATKPTKQDDTDQNDIFLEIEVDKDSVYPQQQVLYTVRLYRSVVIENASLSSPRWSGGDLVVERLGDDRRYQTVRNNIRYAVTERKFALFPQSSGIIVIEPVEFQGAVPSNTTSLLNFWDQPLARPIQLRSETFHLEVKELPAGASNPWLPSTGVTLEEQWSHQDTTTVGEPISRTIKVTARGMIGSQLPEPSFPLPTGIKHYPEQAVNESTAIEGGAVGQVTQTVALVPTQVGELTIPEYQLQWWNVETDQLEIARLPSRSFSVVESELIPANPPTTTPDSIEPVTEQIEVVDKTGWWVSLALLALWLITLLLWWLNRKTEGKQKIQNDTEQKRRLTHGQSLKALKAACVANDANAAKDALLQWTQSIDPDRSPYNLEQLRYLLDEQSFSKIQKLQEALYSDKGEWQDDGLYQIVSGIKINSSNKDKNVDYLKPLYSS